MIKFVFLLCVVSLAAGTQASFWTDSLSKTQGVIDATLELSIDGIHETVNAAQEKAEIMREQLQTTADEVISQLYEQIRDQKQQIDVRVSEATANADNVDVSECTKVAETFHVDIESTVNRTIQCVLKKKNAGDEFVDSIAKTASVVLKKFNDVREMAQQCSDGINEYTPTSTVLNAIVCASKATTNATQISKKAVPAFKRDLSKKLHEISIHQNSLSTCSAASSVLTDLTRESELVLNEVKTCVSKKIAPTAISAPAAAPATAATAATAATPATAATAATEAPKAI